MKNICGRNVKSVLDELTFLVDKWGRPQVQDKQKIIIQAYTKPIYTDCISFLLKKVFFRAEEIKWIGQPSFMDDNHRVCNSMFENIHSQRGLYWDVQKVYIYSISYYELPFSPTSYFFKPEKVFVFRGVLEKFTK